MNKILQTMAVAGLLAAWQGAKPSNPEVPKILEAPAGEELVLSAHAKGVQIYVCRAGADQKFSWALQGPEAELSDAKGEIIAHHFAGPTWKHVDGTEVTGKMLQQDTPKPDAIPWLLLAAKSHTGQGVFSRVTSIQRINTVGGLPPAGNTCDSSTNPKEARISYEADYYFYAPAPK
jgi:uncharacterized protein DUF3455